MADAVKPDYTVLTFPAPPPDRPYVILNMVSSADGKVVIEGTEQGLGSTTDQRLMRELRVHADVVMNGAGTLRASGTSSRVGDPGLEAIRVERGKPSAPIAAVLTGSGELPLERAFFTARDFEAVVYLSSNAPAARRGALEATGRRVFEAPAGDEVPWMLRHMREELGAEMLLVEGGPTLNGELFEQGFVDEYFMTLGPVVVGGHDMLSPVEGERTPSKELVTRLELVTAVANPATSEVYLRYRVSRSG